MSLRDWADNILFTAVEKSDDMEWGQVLEKARDRFLEKDTHAGPGQRSANHL